MTPLPPPLAMLKLPTFQPAEIEAPAQMFRCDFYRATIAAGVCVARQKHRYTPRLGGGKVGVARITVQYQHCASGECEQGNTIAERLEGYEPETEAEKKDRKRAAATRVGKAEVAAIEEKLATPPSPGGLSERELEVLELLAKGLENAEIGRVLAISKATVRTHLEHVYVKLDVTNRVEAATEAIRLGLTEEARLDEIDKVLEETTTAMEPAAPAEEEKMGLKGPKSPLDGVTDEEFRKAFLEADGKIERLRKQYGAAHSTTARRADALGLRASRAKPPRKAKKAPTLVDVAKKHTSKPILKDAPYAGPVSANDDVVVLLQQKRQHHLDQAARIDKALEALREVG